MKGTIVWKIPDDEGVWHKFKIQESYYAPDGEVRLLSPQHWAKQYKLQNQKNTKSTTTEDDVILDWNDGKNKLTLPLDKDTNVATIMETKHPSFQAFPMEIKIKYTQESHIQREFLHLHCQLGHISPYIIQKMAKL